jgi:hypothetical protein
MAWVRADEWQERQWAREDAAFARRANQGELCAPMILRDTMRPVQSQVDGHVYESKSEIRKHYKREGMIEVGNDVPKTRFSHGSKPLPEVNKDRNQDAAMAKFMQRLDIGGERITKIVHDEDGMKRLAHQAEKRFK